MNAKPKTELNSFVFIQKRCDVNGVLAIDYQQHVWAKWACLDFSAQSKCRLIPLYKPFKQFWKSTVTSLAW